MQCPNCGQSYQQGDLFCGECGTKLDQITPSTTTPESLNLDSHINKSVNHSTSSSVTSPNAVSKEQPTVNQYNNIESSQTQDAPDYTSYQQRYGNPRASSQKVKSVVEESKKFFKQVFKRHDTIIESHHSFSYSLLASLVIVGLLILGFFIHFMIEDSFGYIVSGVFTIVLRVILGIAIAIAILFFITYGVIRLTVLQPFQIKKVLSDFILTNTLSVLILLLGFISLFLKLYILSGVLGVFSIILLFTSCIYLIAKYSVNRKLRIPSFYGVIIFFVIIGFALHLFGSSLISQFDDFGVLRRLFGRGFSGLL